ncbi:MAG: GNAT family N-acetyltransferase [Firmicutes bacterium]|nr:GNAT family N-acetyltransferase [Bacillota bacterium]
MFEVKNIEPEMTYNIRHSILRPHQSFEDCKYDTDFKKNTFHVGAFYQGRLISIASFCERKNIDFTSEKQYQLRAMATLEEYRKLGAGRAVVNYAESFLQREKIEILWCKGRTNVQKYYKRLGFITHGEVFDYPPIGPHIVMYKKINEGNIY